jgi:dihydrodipicolinate synthase/N-acetylneuraminate lyase
MSRPTQTAVERRKLLARLFPGGIPVLWCPLITHYDRDGAIDVQRMGAHLKHLSPHIKGFLIPGSTGDGWELNEDESRRLVGIALEQMSALNLRLLIGVLKTDPGEALRLIADNLAWLGSGTSADGIRDQSRDPKPALESLESSDTVHGSIQASDQGGVEGPSESGESLADQPDAERFAESLIHAHVSGFTVCPPRGKELSQDKIGEALASILRRGAPTALYQLPQITLNEMHPEVVAALARQFPNFILFKDTSGADHVALSGQKLENVFLVRGAEGDYIRWLKAAKGPYDGFLLSTANCFGRQFHELVADLATRRPKPAQELSDRLTSCINEVFGMVSGLPAGNPFANANKAMDHFMAWGPRALDVAPPRLHAGSCLPGDVIRGTGEALSRHGLMPDKGYLE